MKRQRFLLPAAVLLAITILCGCGASGTDASTVPPEVSAEVISENSSFDFNSLDTNNLPVYMDIDGKEFDLEQLRSFMQEHPQVTIHAPVDFCGQIVYTDTESLAAEAENIDEFCRQSVLFNRLEDIEINGRTLETDELMHLKQSFPEVKLHCLIGLFNGTYSSDTDEIIVAGLSNDTLNELSTALPYFNALEVIRINPDVVNEFDTELFQNIEKIQSITDASVDCRFNLYGCEFSTADESMNLRNVRIYDNAEQLLTVLPVMNRCTYLDMDSCGVGNETMEAIRDSFPDIKVVWRVHFSVYSARTDDTKILASIKGYNMTGATVECLKYCTDVKYLDLGHNIIDDISFVQYMPDLEVAILAINYWTDAEPLRNCKNLEYLEIFNTNLSDLSPLSELTNLKHLNICFLYNLHDITPIYSLTNLERLWIGCLTPIPDEQIEEFKRLVPDCVVNDTTLSPTEEGWRDDPRYDLLIQQFGYNDPETAYSFHYND